MFTTRPSAEENGRVRKGLEAALDRVTYAARGVVAACKLGLMLSPLSPAPHWSVGGDEVNRPTRDELRSEDNQFIRNPGTVCYIPSSNPECFAMVGKQQACLVFGIQPANRFVGCMHRCFVGAVRFRIRLQIFSNPEKKLTRQAFTSNIPR